MHSKPDVIRALVILFAVGLLVTGITSFASSDSGTPALTETSLFSLPAASVQREASY